MFSKLIVIFAVFNFMTEGSWIFNPIFGPFAPPAGSPPYGGPPAITKPNVTGKPWGPWGPFGPWGPYGPYKPVPPYPPQTRIAKRSLAGPYFYPPLAFVQQMITSKLEGISSAIIMKKQFKAIASDLNDQLEVAKVALESDLEQLNLVAENEAMLAEKSGRDVTACVSALQSASQEITSKINALDLDVEESELGKNITRDINSLKAQAGMYGMSFKGCKSKFVPTSVQMGGIEECATDTKQFLDQSADNKKVVINEEIAALQNQVDSLINNTTNEVTKLVRQATNNFMVCSN